MAAPATVSPARTRGPFWRPRTGWGLLVGVSAVLLLGAVIALAAGWIATSTTRISTYAVTGSLSGIQLNVRSGNVEVVGGGSGPVLVRRTDRFAFGHHSTETRSVAGGALAIASRCPPVEVGKCSADYRITVPDNVPVNVKTGDGSIHLAVYRGSAVLQAGSGNVTVDAFCGFGLSVRTGSGSIHTTTACSPQRLALRSGSGAIAVTVPTGRYGVTADSNGGSRSVSGIQQSADAPFQIQALSSSGSVSVKGAP